VSPELSRRYAITVLVFDVLFRGSLPLLLALAGLGAGIMTTSVLVLRRRLTAV